MGRLHKLKLLLMLASLIYSCNFLSTTLRRHMYSLPTDTRGVIDDSFSLDLLLNT